MEEEETGGEQSTRGLLFGLLFGAFDLLLLLLLLLLPVGKLLLGLRDVLGGLRRSFRLLLGDENSSLCNLIVFKTLELFSQLNSYC